MTTILVICSLLLLFIILLYNGLISKKNNVENAFATIDVQLKLRYDLIPNLIAVVKNYMQHEQSLLTRLTELRTKAISENIDEASKLQLNSEIDRTVGNLLVSVENYPELKATESFSNLQKALNEVEAQIAAARRAFNAAVTDYNSALEMFPTNLMAKHMNLIKKQVYEAQVQERNNPNVQDLFKSKN